MIISKILKEYKSLSANYALLQTKAHSTIERALIKDTIPYHKIESRLKDRKVVENKIIRKNFKYSTIREITDVVGVRIIVLYEDEIDKISALVRKLFRIDVKNSSDKLSILETDRFGYRSVHYVASFTPSGLKFEIQIRTILQHAWAELSHRLGYKSELEIPRVNLREFSRLSGLLEIGDNSFMNLRNELLRYSKHVKKDINKLSRFDINKESIKVFINHDPLIKRIDGAVMRGIKGKIVNNDYFDDELKVAQYLKLNRLSDLRSLIHSNQKLIVDSAKRTYLYLNEKRIAKGIGIVFLGYIIADRNGGDSEINELLNRIELLPQIERKPFSITLHNRINNYI